MVVVKVVTVMVAVMVVAVIAVAVMVVEPTQRFLEESRRLEDRKSPSVSPSSLQSRT